MASPLSGQVNFFGSVGAVPLSATALNVTAFTIKASAANGSPVYIGGPNVLTTTGYRLDPGDAFEYEHLQQSGVANYPLSVSDFYVNGSSGDQVTWLASP